MQEETIISNVPGAAQRRYLRPDSAPPEKSLCFIYIGSDTGSLRALSGNFEAGVVAKDFEGAKKIIQSQHFNKQDVDAIIIDVPYNLAALKQFYYFLSANGNIAATIPVLYNSFHLNVDGSMVQPQYVDDVIDLASWQYDLAGKISFLQRAKEYILAQKAEAAQLKPKPTYFKRTIDILAAGTMILLLSPIFLLIAIAIRLESRGPIFYNAKRAGRGFRIFKFYKFRTMVVNADKKMDALSHLNQYSANEGPKFFKIANDPRITKVGRILRNTSLDELPQLFNVLKGDMSLVGNRPLPLYEAATLTTNDCVERFMAPAGITGLWQIKKRGQNDMSTEERINLDISYAQKSNLLYDFWIIAQTPKALIQKTDV